MAEVKVVPCGARHDCLVIGKEHVSVRPEIVKALKAARAEADDLHQRVHEALAVPTTEADEEGE